MSFISMDLLKRIFGMLSILVLLGLFLRYNMRKGSRSNEKHMKNFLESEREANGARRKEIEPELFYRPQLDALPFKHDGSAPEKKVLKCAEPVMLHFPRHRTNVELKMAYGPSQLEFIALYEENFNRYLAALIEWAKVRMENDGPEDALSILEHALALGSDYRKGYMLAADLYAKAGDVDKLTALLQKAEGQYFQDEGIKRSIIRYIMDKRAEI